MSTGVHFHSSKNARLDTRVAAITCIAVVSLSAYKIRILCGAGFTRERADKRGICGHCGHCHLGHTPARVTSIELLVPHPLVCGPLDPFVHGARGVQPTKTHQTVCEPAPVNKTNMELGHFVRTSTRRRIRPVATSRRRCRAHALAAHANLPPQIDEQLFYSPSSSQAMGARRHVRRWRQPKQCWNAPLSQERVDRG